ncbi:MAG: NTP transferase domain-containing protein [Coprothermobacterota bacterium]|nr:NTP transferase domain-containing protein [Coprothermobacterota bacterium]
MQERLYAVVLAAGLGKRMKSALPKVLHPLLGRPMLSYALDSLKPLNLVQTVIVVGHGGELVQQCTGSGFCYVRQNNQLGTGHALQQAREALNGETGALLVLPGDIPLLHTTHLSRLLEVHQESQCLGSVLTALVEDPSLLGRVCRNADGTFDSIIEEADASPSQKKIHEVSTSVYAFSLPAVFDYLERLCPENAQGEYYLNDVLPMMRKAGNVQAIRVDDIPIIGVNDRVQLSQCRRILHDRILRDWMRAGVTMEDPATVSLDWEVRLKPDTVIKPFTVLEGACCIGQGCVLGPFLHLVDAVIPDGTRMQGLSNRGEER